MSFLVIRSYADLTLIDGQLLDFRAHAIIAHSGNEVLTVFKPTIPVIALVLITSLISFVNIFLYHRRITQIRLCFLNSCLLASLMVVMLSYYYSVNNSLSVTKHAFHIPVIFPVMSIIFSFMAAKAIQHDEMLVKSYDRVRK
jgi:glucan phosphoethanolaminetransferase (alkaline phosphatase superfamily)